MALPTNTAAQGGQDMTEIYMSLPYIVPIRRRVEAMEARLNRIEAALNTILQKFRLPPLESVDTRSKPTPQEASPEKQVEPKPMELDPAKLARYEYEPLDASKSEIRVLALVSSSNDTDPVKCSLVTASLDLNKIPLMRDRSLAGMALSSFIALSYTWGEPKFDSSIILDGRMLPVTKNLEAALRQFRKPKSLAPQLTATQAKSPHLRTAMAAQQARASYWWIDAICINQDDVDERNSQVALMRRIYKTAHAVCIWLGEEADDSALALDVINQITRPPARGPGEASTAYPNVPDEERLRSWKALSALFRRPWWERAWIRQEVTLARSPTVQCGSASCGFHSFVSVLKALRYVVQYLGYDPTESDSNSLGAETGWKPLWFESAEILNKLSKDTRSGSSYMPLANLLAHARASKATDLRDKVFSVLGLADPEIYELAADYRLAFTDVYMKTTRTIIEKTKRLDILSACQNPERLHNLPSWVPNLADSWKTQPFRSTEGRSSREADFSFDNDGRVLRARGCFNGSVKTIHEAFVRASDLTEQLNSTYLAWKDFIKNADDMFAHLRRRHDFMREKLTDRWHDRAWLDLLTVNASQNGDFASKETSPGHWEPVSPEPPVEYAATLNLRFIKSLLVPDSLHDVKPHPFYKVHWALRDYGLGRRLGLSSEGAVCFLPHGVQEGDLIVEFDGASFPYILRKQDNGYLVIGETCKSPLVLVSSVGQVRSTHC
jgi:Heterokaryon incompatibility protein (HET)